MGGKRLTPAEIERAAAIYAETGNAAAAAEAIGVAKQTLHDAFKRMRLGRNRTLHAQACERGLRKARARLMRIGEIAEKVIDGEGVGLEPKDLAALINAVSKNVDTLAGISDREERRKQSALTREKTRAEIALLKRKISGEHVERIEVATDDTLDARINELLSGGPPPTDEGSEG